MKREIANRVRPGERIDIVDVGCGSRPYARLLEPHVRNYVGVDVDPATADVVAPAERLPLEDESFDWALCMQVLEHTDSPSAAVAELRRVVRSGGVVLASTHGVFRYHPNPGDHWRWTHTGLQRLFGEAGEWKELHVYPNAGTATTLAYLLSTEIATLASKARLSSLAFPLFVLLNWAAWMIDRRLKRVYGVRPPTLTANYLVVAVR